MVNKWDIKQQFSKSTREFKYENYNIIIGRKKHHFQKSKNKKLNSSSNLANGLLHLKLLLTIGMIEIHELRTANS